MNVNLAEGRWKAFVHACTVSLVIRKFYSGYLASEPPCSESAKLLRLAELQQAMRPGELSNSKLKMRKMSRRAVEGVN